MSDKSQCEKFQYGKLKKNTKLYENFNKNRAI